MRRDNVLGWSCYSSHSSAADKEGRHGGFPFSCDSFSFFPFTNLMKKNLLLMISD
jgi:hypothetical protein